MRSLIAWLPSALRKNMFWLALARVSAQLLSVFVVAVAARRLGPVDFGRYSFYAATLMLGNTFTAFGTETLIMRETAKTRQLVPIVGQALGLQVVLSLLWLGGLLLLGLDLELLLLSLSLLPFAWLSVSSAVLRGFERMDLFWLTVLINSTLQFASAMLTWDLRSLCLILLVGNLITGVCAVWITSASLPNFNLPLRLDFAPLLRISLPFALVTVTAMALQRLGIFFATTLLDGHAAGLFSAATRIYEGLKLGHYAVLGALLPVLSHAADRPKPGTLRNLSISLLGFSVILAGAFSLASRWVVEIIFGAEYLSASHLVALVVWSLIPYTFSSVVFVDLVSRNLEHVMAGLSVANLLIAVGIFAWLVGSLGVQGAVYATMLNESIFAGLCIVFWIRYVRQAR